PAEQVLAALASAGIDPDRRPQTVAVGEWIRLLEEIGPIGPDERGRLRHVGHSGQASQQARPDATE
ncbi:MAG TPA: hypothetical protein VIB99_00770, partial [Candidatus Limnocylindrales bacterium]